MALRLAKQVGLLLVMVAAGTLIDWAVHSSYGPWYVEGEYYRNKILFGTAFGLIGFYALKYVLGVRTLRGFIWGVPAVIAAILQTKYFYQGRDLTFVLVFLFGHYLMFLPGSWFIFRKYPDVFTGSAMGAGGHLYWGRFIALALAVEVLFYLYFMNLYGWVR